MKELIIEKTSKLKFSLDVFISIVVFVFTLGMAWSSINAKQNQMITKLEEVASLQEERITIDQFKEYTSIKIGHKDKDWTIYY